MPHGPGHNHSHARAPAQWQTPHQPDGTKSGAAAPEPDLDKVEAAFVDGFLQAPDPTSFLRLARIPFEIAAADTNLKLLRVEIDALTDVGSLTPHLGGGAFRYDPLPSNFVSRRRRLRFVYFDGSNLCPLTYAALRELEAPASPSSLR
ncbi:hypothetical protein [Bradyrhizobium guangdongense]|uniref:hypothetical protein n=1 Tax=Bradyrhizobium guangdongense TaxID=1325090 RepID=UPI001642F3CE|nr:hypothetical protein [Bradyrhizobium guangdongense]